MTTELNQETRLRKATRGAFTRNLRQLKALLEESETDKTAVQVSYNVLEGRAAELREQDAKIMVLLLQDDEADLDMEMEVAENYYSKFLEIKVSAMLTLEGSSVDNLGGSNNAIQHNPRKFKLPKLEFRKFGDDVKDWLPFWSQFQKIDDDDEIAPEDKFQYLIQATIQGSRAREVVESFPPTGDNYNKVVASLKARFGREDLQVEVYVREVLKLIISVHQDKQNMTMSFLYDKLESYLRALETLGVTTDRCSAMLFPLVESCFPEEFLKAWHRTGSLSQGGDAKERLNKLMDFLRSEVEGEERISLAMAGFGLKNEGEKLTGKKKQVSSQYAKEVIPTAAGLLSTFTVPEPDNTCVFCEGKHNSSECYSARKMTLLDKQKRLKEKNCCFCCLRPGHQFRRCKAKVRCVICEKRHMTLMCDQLKQKCYVDKRSYNNGSQVTEKEVSLTTLTCRPKVFLQTLKVKLYCEKQERFVRALIDSGSQKSYILKDTAVNLGYTPLRNETIVHSLFGGECTEGRRHNCFKIRMSTLDGSFRCNFDALDQDIICGDIQPVGRGSWLEELRKKNISLTDVGETPDTIEVLIGADVLGGLLTGRHEVLSCGLVAVETRLGWTLMGKVPQQDDDTNLAMMVTSLFIKEADISDLWRLDVIGIRDPVERKTKEEEELLTKEHFLRTVKFTAEERYEVYLPWKDDCPPLADGLCLAKKRLDTMTKRLVADGLYRDYEEILLDWLKEGIVEEVPLTEAGSYGHYLPHRPVVKESSATTRIRPVFDASARMPNHPSLNHCLECGPNLIELIPDVILRFREKKIGVIADIKKAFLQISVNKEDRDYLRFLWWKDFDNGKYRIFRHTRVVFGVKCSPFLLGAVVEYHLKNYVDCDSVWVQQLLKSFYVDNVATSVETQEELLQFVSQASELMSKGGFDLRGWGYSGETPKGEENDILVLGLLWDRHLDVLRVSLNGLKDVDLGVITKRTILSVTHKIFDPVGYTSPITLCPKMMLQKTWKMGLGWDVEITGLLRNEFLRWFRELDVLKDFCVPRWLGVTKENLQDCSVHTFCDASQTAYGAVTYLRIQAGDKIMVSLLASKARVAPLRDITIPRLELLAALVGVRLSNSVVECLGWKELKRYQWSDSSTVLAWITREENWSVFVRNRVQEIRRLGLTSSWGHVSGEENPADLASRGCGAKQLIADKWWEGPPWMHRPLIEWPCVSSAHLPEDQEAIAKERLKSTCLLSRSDPINKNDWYYKYFSKYGKILRLVAWILRFSHNCLHSKGVRKQGELTRQELNEAEKKIVGMIQQESFTGEKDDRLKTLAVYKDEKGILRLKTKIVYRKDEEDFRKPAILPSHHEVVKRLIYSYHVQNVHAGTQILLNILREHYWILNGRKTVRSVLAKCTVCKRYTMRKLDTDAAPLPENRVRDAKAFEITGVDLAGPLFLKGSEKAWVCLFTCAVYRAVHLELITAISTESFLLALRRFVARRGRCSVIYCDNGTNFVGAANVLRALDWKAIVRYNPLKPIEWKFNPPTAPWWGGWWERMIRILKDMLKRVLGQACLAYEEMITILCDCEAVINSRPLTYLTEGESDLVPLTPAMFLQDVTEWGMPDCDVVDQKSMNKRIKYRQTLRKDLRNRFRSEYLGQLIQRTNSKKHLYSVAVGDIVLVGTDNSRRLNWPLARVLEVIPGKEGTVRLVKLQTSHAEILRPIQRIYPLEVSAADPLGERILIVEKAERRKSSGKSALPSTSLQLKKPQTNRFGRVVKIPQRLDL